MSELIKTSKINAVQVFSGEGLNDLLEQIRKEATSEVPDPKTAKGRKAIASMAAKVAKSKTYLDGLGKDLVADWKSKSKAVDAERLKMRNYLDDLKAEVRRPLTDWEFEEVNRIKNHENSLAWITNIGESCDDYLEVELPLMTGRLYEIKSLSIYDEWEEFANDAAKAKDMAISKIERAIEKREKYDTEQVELEKLRQEAAAQAQKDREEQLRREGEERARIEAEAKATAESERVERELQEAESARLLAIKEKEQAERDAIETKERAAKEIAEAEQRERERIEAERVAQEIAAKKREADKEHRIKINNLALEGLVDAGIPVTHARKVVVVIAKCLIPYVRISY